MGDSETELVSVLVTVREWRADVTVRESDTNAELEGEPLPWDCVLLAETDTALDSVSVQEADAVHDVESAAVCEKVLEGVGVGGGVMVSVTVAESVAETEKVLPLTSPPFAPNCCLPVKDVLASLVSVEDSVETAETD